MPRRVLPASPSRSSTNVGTAHAHRLAAFLGLVTITTAGADAQQFVRPAERVDAGTLISASDPTPATEGELSAVLFRSDDRVAVCVSTDRGLTWGAPVQVDDDATGAPKWVATEDRSPTITIQAGVLHAVWRDARNGYDDLWTSRSLDGGVSWSANVRLDKGFPSGTAPVREYTLASTLVAGVAHLHVLFTVDPGSTGNFQPDELYLVSSTDGGQTWGGARTVSSQNGSGADVDSFALDADGDDLVIVWSDDRFGSSTNDDVWIVRSLDAGQTFTGPERQVDPSGPLNGDVENELALAAEGDLLAIGWEEEFGSVREEAWLAISTDRGTSFAFGGRIGLAPPSTADVDDVAVAVHDGVVYAGWDDDRAGLDQVRVVHTSDLGATFSPERQLSTTAGGELVFTTGDDFVLASFSGDGAGTGDAARFAFTRDGGVTWSLTADLSSNTRDVDDVRPAWNARYGNVIAPWIADDAGTNGIWVGGFRPQTVTPVNWVSGGQAVLEFEAFRPGTDFVWALGSSAPGDLILGLGDGRNLGLFPDAIFFLTLQNPLVFATALDSQGAGSTPPSPLPVASGTVFHIAAVGFDLGPVALQELTDVVRVVVQ